MKGITSDYSRPARIQKLANAVFNVSNAAIGSGVLAFPFAYKQSGLVLGVIVTICAASLLSFTLTILARCAREFEVNSYQALAGAMYGKSARNMLLGTQFVYCFFAGIAYLMVLSRLTIYFTLFFKLSVIF
jgi:amino acid permease